jgi:hypothetical protein
MAKAKQVNRLKQKNNDFLSKTRARNMLKEMHEYAAVRDWKLKLTYSRDFQHPWRVDKNSRTITVNALGRRRHALVFQTALAITWATDRDDEAYAYFIDYKFSNNKSFAGEVERMKTLERAWYRAVDVFFACAPHPRAAEEIEGKFVKYALASLRRDFGQRVRRVTENRLTGYGLKA